MAEAATILFVEDDDNDVVLVRRAFQKAGLTHCVIAVEDSFQAIAYLSGNPPFTDRNEHPFPDFVLLDLKLVGSSGFEVLTWLRDRPERKGLPVVAFSSSWIKADIETAKELGADDYLVKPNGFEELIKVVKQLDERWLKRG
ncbi:MAG TPA: response regulator [Bacillota bacterium]|nr:response regulator [Bacillota bacterium]